MSAARNRGSVCSGSPSVTVSVIPGYRRLYSASASVSSVTLALGKLATRSSPPSRPAIAASSCSASSRRQKTASACERRMRPASVSLGPEAVRSSSGIPTSRSSVATCWLTADCER